MYIQHTFKYIVLGLLILIQIILLLLYILLQKNFEYKHNLTNIQFINSSRKHDSADLHLTFLNDNYTTSLNRIETKNDYEDFKTSVCYRNGTDINTMKKSKEAHWKCLCLPGWHGNDCGQPEVIWRAMLARRNAIKVPVLRYTKRRIIYIINIKFLYIPLLEIKINEMKDTVDLYVIHCNTFAKIMKYKSFINLLKPLKDKVYFSNSVNLSNIWNSVLKTVTNINDDDIVVVDTINEILNRQALEYFKLYDKLPQSVGFRLKWCVFGFYWKHPKQTITSARAFTVQYFTEVVNSKENEKNFKYDFVIGDLNHYGGWYCEYCLEHEDIVTSLSDLSQIDWKNINNKKIDVNYIENLVSDGLYVDSKTILERCRRYEAHYAPEYAMEYSWKYDWLITNLFSKLDY